MILRIDDLPHAGNACAFPLVWRVAEAMVDFAKPQHETLEERLRGLGMHIMFVCTGNICRSPMGELLMTHYLNGTTVQVSSAGTRVLCRRAIRLDCRAASLYAKAS